MRDLVDLHLHSLFSDGILTPTELVVEAASLGLRAIALADHDNVDGTTTWKDHVAKVKTDNPKS